MHIIAATDAQGGIGWQGQLPWHNSYDLQFFREKTMGQSVLMGSTTWKGFRRPLPGRNNIVLSSKPQPIEGLLWVSSLEQAVQKATQLDTELWIIGGANVYRQALDYAQTAYINVIFGKYQTDVEFPTFGRQWIMDEYVIDASGTFATQHWTNQSPQLLP